MIDFTPVAVWLQMILMIWTHRIIRLAPGVYVQAERGTTNAQVAAALAAYTKLKGK